ncbi:MAG: hydrogenase expression/formation protein HypE [Omnitrophica WOR_2 bacterium SM23_72]|nr:MAG: hydrogenase expression/formation protein HypE [Omnitrophica WOR_2 bacterium SM23_72]
MAQQKILLGHGSGGRLMHQLITNLMLKKLNNPILKELSDSARLPYREKIAFTTDSFVVSPLAFPGGNIGKLAVCGTVNDLVVAGARPEYLSLALILEEGLDCRLLEKIVESIAVYCRRTGVSCVTGDIKVVEKGACDKMFINTTGIGRMVKTRPLSVKNIKAGDRIIITGEIGQHGMAVLSKREELGLRLNIKSDCRALDSLLLPLLKKIQGVRFMRDPTRGGLVSTLHEIIQATGLGIRIEEKQIPVSGQVKVACELLGIDPLYVANEGCAVVVVAGKSAKKALRLLKKHPLGRKARLAGEVISKPQGRLILETRLGTQRLLEMLTSEPLPRIC